MIDLSCDAVVITCAGTLTRLICVCACVCDLINIELGGHEMQQENKAANFFLFPVRQSEFVFLVEKYPGFHSLEQFSCKTAAAT